MITASHNPPEYNGIKLLNPDGSSFGPEQRRQIEVGVFDDSVPAAPWREIGSSSTFSGAVEEHVARILKDFPGELKLKVVVDSGGGAAYHITPYLFRRLGCEVVEINCHPTGLFPRSGEPTEANLWELLKATRECKADLGIAHDGDADRMMAVDERGRFIPGDKLLILLARAVGAGEVVTTVDTSMIIEEMGFKVTRTRVGDTHVSQELRGGGDFGGEPSGSWIFPGISLCPDGIYAAAQMAAIASQQKLSQLVDDIPSYPVFRSSINGKLAGDAELEQALLAMEPVAVSTVDGLKLSFKDGWLLVRSSGTEPKIRITAEADSEKRTRELHDSAARVIEGLLVKG